MIQSWKSPECLKHFSSNLFKNLIKIELEVFELSRVKKVPHSIFHHLYSR